MFQKAKQIRVFQDVVEQIKDAIFEGTLKPGDKLPPERELKEMFGTSRGTLREALRILEQKGLITIKTGVTGGAVVNALTTHQVSESLDLLIRYQKVSLKDLAEFREGVEGMVTELATKRAKKEDIAYLKKLLAESKTYLDKGVSQWNEVIRLNNQIHTALARISGNPVYESVLRTIYDNINRYFNHLVPPEIEFLESSYHDLFKIVKAVEKRQVAKARVLVKKHIYRYNRLMKQRAQQENS